MPAFIVIPILAIALGISAGLCIARRGIVALVITTIALLLAWGAIGLVIDEIHLRGVIAEKRAEYDGRGSVETPERIGFITLSWSIRESATGPTQPATGQRITRDWAAPALYAGLGFACSVPFAGAMLAVRKNRT
ncbi:MAG: hypothetical protein AAFX05_05570 [Planctomycetota bacterium]